MIAIHIHCDHFVGDPATGRCLWTDTTTWTDFPAAVIALDQAEARLLETGWARIGDGSRRLVCPDHNPDRPAVRGDMLVAGLEPSRPGREPSEG